MLTNSRTLFIISSLPRPIVSVVAIVEGHEALSGSLSSFLLVVNELARRGRQVGLIILDGRKVADLDIAMFSNIHEAVSWLSGGKAVWCSWGDHSTLDILSHAGLNPLVWLQTHIGEPEIRMLKARRIQGIVTVSDLARLPFLHLSCHHQIGRVYNSLNPFYALPRTGTPNRYESRHAVFTGYFGESKGTHRVLQAWPMVLDRVGSARLTIAGSVTLYGDKRDRGRLGLASPDFEEHYLVPLLAKYGSFEACGISFTGMLSPTALVNLYDQAALGIVNPNWSGSTETFCCTAVEMLATGLPVVSVARGGLPETIGCSIGSELLKTASLDDLASSISQLLQDPRRLQSMAMSAQNLMRSRYCLATITDRWEKMLSANPRDLDRETGSWGYSGRRLRRILERALALVGCGDTFDWIRGFARSIKHTRPSHVSDS